MAAPGGRKAQQPSAPPGSDGAPIMGWHRNGGNARRRWRHMRAASSTERKCLAVAKAVRQHVSSALRRLSAGRRLSSLRFLAIWRATSGSSRLDGANIPPASRWRVADDGAVGAYCVGLSTESQGGQVSPKKSPHRAGGSVGRSPVSSSRRSIPTICLIANAGGCHGRVKRMPLCTCRQPSPWRCPRAWRSRHSAGF